MAQGRADLHGLRLYGAKMITHFIRFSCRDCESGFVHVPEDIRTGEIVGEDGIYAGECWDCENRGMTQLETRIRMKVRK